MKRFQLILFSIINAVMASGQTVYTGFVDKYPVEFIVDQMYSANGDSQSINGLYMYTRFNEPISLTGTINKKKLVLNEQNSNGKTTANFVFNPYFQEKDSIIGIWKNSVTNKELSVRLSRKYNFDVYDSVNYRIQDRELLQAASLKNYFFKILVSKDTSNHYAKVLEVNRVEVCEKKTGKIFQTVDLNCEFKLGFNSVDVNDYNFDGIPDFCVFERSYTGPNTTSRYFLNDPKTNRFFDSKYEGVSLEFDEKKKLIYEHDELDLGSEVINSVYKVVNNKMVPVKQSAIKKNSKDY